MDVERGSSNDKSGEKKLRPSPVSHPGLQEAIKRWRSCARLALPVACMAAILLAAGVLFTAWGSPDLRRIPSWLDGLTDPPPSNPTAHQLLDGLITADFGERSCRSRYEFADYYTKASAHKPSPYLLAKLRKHEALQKRCGPGTAPYRAALWQLMSGNGIAASECRYLVSISYRGLGNRMLATASAFLYAVLTERALLVHQYHRDIGSLFCEPFPGTTWLLPSGWRFPLKHLRDYDGSSKESLGSMLQSNVLSVGPYGNATWADGGERRPPYVYLHLDGGYGYHDKLFYCDEHQRLLRGAPWLLMKTDSYLVPGLILLPSFRGELAAMFPEKDAAFHHLGRYLFHPANEVWRSVTGYYAANLAGAARRVGIQIRVFQEINQTQLQLQEQVLDVVLSCVRREKLLASSKNASVLVTSLSPWYADRIRGEYGGGVHQPSSEGRQKWGDTSHDMAALAEIYLLGTCDVLVTTGFSTFGYVAQGLAGLRPWIMPRLPVSSEKTPDPPCARAVSVEPCFQSPSWYDCAARKDVDLGTVVPYIRRCEDVSWGIKIVNETNQQS